MRDIYTILFSAITLCNLFALGCDDKSVIRLDGGLLRDAAPLSDIGEAGSEEIDMEIAGQEIEEADVGMSGAESDLGSQCTDEVTCDEEGRLRRCVEGEWIAESCPPGTSCDEQSGACVEMG